MWIARDARPFSPTAGTDDATGLGGRAPSGIGFAIAADGTGIHHKSTSSSESRSETNATLVPSGDTRGYVSLSVVSVSGNGACHASEPPTGESRNRSNWRLGSAGRPAGLTSRCANTNRPSAVHDGHRSSPAIVVTATGVPAAMPFFNVTTKMLKPSPRSAANASLLPSADQAGSRSIVEASP